MDKILVLYSSRDGQTRKIVDVMLEQMPGCEVVMHDLHTLADVQPKQVCQGLDRSLYPLWQLPPQPVQLYSRSSGAVGGGQCGLLPVST